MVIEFLAILWYFIKQKLQNIAENYAAIWLTKQAADFSSFMLAVIYADHHLCRVSSAEIST